MGPMSITKLSPNWACQMGTIHCAKFLMSGTAVAGKNLRFFRKYFRFLGFLVFFRFLRFFRF